jgi:hypothetical protein
MTSLPISSASISSAITASAEETHPEAMFQLVMKTLDNPCIKPYLNKIKGWLYHSQQKHMQSIHSSYYSNQ